MLTISDDRLIFVCDPEKNTECSKTDCYVTGGRCCLTFNEDFKCDIFDQEFLEKLEPFSYGDFLPKVLRKIYSQKKQST